MSEIWQIPPYDPQYSPIDDSDSCSNQATLHVLEMLQGNKQRWSPRALAVLSGTVPGKGNSVQNNLNAINKYGLIPYDLWPDLTGNWTVAEYYAPIPANILAQANKSYFVRFAAADLTISPLLVEIQVSPTMSHLMAEFNTTDVFDSYPPSVKPLTTWEPKEIVGKWGLSINPKNMTFGFQVSNPTTAGDKTVYIQAGNALVPLSDWQAFLNLGGSEASIVQITQQQLNASLVVTSDLFKTNS